MRPTHPFQLTFVAILAAVFMMPSLAHADIVLAGFDAPGDDTTGNVDTTANVLATGWSATVSDARAFADQAGRNSTDMTFGSEPGAASAVGSIDIVDSDAFGRRTIDFTLTNNTGADFDLKDASFRFDWNTTNLLTAPDSFTVIYAATPSGDSLGADNVNLGSATLTSTGYANFDYAFGGLFTDSIFGDTESALFRISADLLAPGTGDSAARSRVDNLAVTTTAVPEPTSLVLFGMGTVSCLTRRRRLK